jgi:hypothetical protein
VLSAELVMRSADRRVKPGGRGPVSVADADETVGFVGSIDFLFSQRVRRLTMTNRADVSSRLST